MKLERAIEKRIFDLCERDRLTINGLATKAGITQSTVDNIVKNKSKNPTIKNLALLAAAFDMSVVEFLDTDEIRKANID